MKKILPLLVVGILVFSGLGAAGITNIATYNAVIKEKSKMMTISFSQLSIDESDNEYIEVNLKDTSSYLMNPGQPMLPKVVKTFELPFGVKNVKVDVTPKTIKEHEVTKEVRPAPIPIPISTYGNDVAVKSKKDEMSYASEGLYPSTWYKYHVGCGLNSEGNWVTHVAVPLFPVRYAPSTGKLYVAESADIKITYENPESNPFPMNSEYDLVIIAPSEFTGDLQKLVNHKDDMGVNTLLKTTGDIYNEYSGFDKPEQIKYFIKDAIETYGIKYVLLVGGLKSLIWGVPRDDANQGTKDWYVPVRYNNIFDNPEHPLSNGSIHDPGVITDLYYADIYREGGVFEDWDPNGDGIIAAWGRPDTENDTGLDLYPDVYVGRLACRNTREVKIVVDKIIKYEQDLADPSWFKKIISFSGDGFLDQEDLDFQWDVNSLPDGEYAIYARSNNPDGVFGPVDELHVTLDRTLESNISFNHDDHLKTDSYPFSPIAEITSPSDGDILGNTDYYYEPTEKEAYCNDFTGWANVEYIDGIMHIRGKSYDPQPYGNLTDIHVWINNSNGDIIFSDWRNDTEMYYEGEWVTGDKLLYGGGGGLYYMPEDFEKELVWSSNGKLTGQQQDVINPLSNGCGFAFFNGHGSPASWGDHLPGIPGNRQHGSVTGLISIDFSGPPFFPMERIFNIYKLPVLLVGGCHNSQLNVSVLFTLLDKNNSGYSWSYGFPTPECWSWWITRLNKRGAIATIGNTGLGYGIYGKECNIGGLDGGICIEFLKQYGVEEHHILGEAYSQTLTTYINNFDMENMDHAKTLHQWAFLGDPSLMIGGYDTGNGGLNANINCLEINGYVTSGEAVMFNGMASEAMGGCNYMWDFDNDGEYDDAMGRVVTWNWDHPDVYEVGLRVTDSQGQVDICDTIVEVKPQMSTLNILEGKTNIEVGETYTYTTGMCGSGSYWNEVYYKFEWGDGTESDWLGPYDYSEDVIASHSWSEGGAYVVRVIALLLHNVPGEEDDIAFTAWSPSLNLNVNQQSNYLDSQNSQQNSGNMQQSMKLLFFKLLEHLQQNIR
jgi:hypothetical protein